MNLIAATELAQQLMRKHGLIQRGWILVWDNAKRRFGQCRHHSRILRLSKPLTSLNLEVDVRDVILHEIAHALVGPRQGHNQVWKNMCVEIGAKPERCYDGQKVNTPDARYIATCGGCGNTYKKHKRPDPTTKRACQCQRGKGWDNKVLLTYVDTKQKQAA